MRRGRPCRLFVWPWGKTPSPEYTHTHTKGKGQRQNKCQSQGKKRKQRQRQRQSQLYQKNVCVNGRKCRQSRMCRRHQKEQNKNTTGVERKEKNHHHLITSQPRSYLHTLHAPGCFFFCSSNMRDRALICCPSGTAMICWLTRACVCCTPSDASPTVSITA